MNDNRLVQVATHSWMSTVQRAQTWFDERGRRDFERVVAPERNRVLYLYGHLIAVHDMMYQLIGLGPRKCEALDALFLRVPDRSAEDYPDPAQLNEYWHELHPRKKPKASESSQRTTGQASIWLYPTKTSR